MLKNYFKLTVRNLWKNKFSSLINLVGLTIGIGCSLLLLMYVRYESAFDDFSEDLDNTFFYYYEQKGANSRKVGLGSQENYEDFSANYAGIEDVVKVRNNPYNMIPQGDPERKMNVRSWFASPNFFDFFNYPLIEGDAEKVLSDPSSIVLTKEVAEKLFPGESAIGKTITLDASSFKKDMVVTGVAKSVNNSHLTFEAIIPWDMKAPDGRHIAHMWYRRSLFIYIKTVPGSNIETIRQEVNAPLVANGSIENMESYFKPLKEMYLGAGDIQFLAFDSGNQQTINSLFLIAIIILVVASINYVNLQTARGIRRSLEVGVRKVMGAHRKQLIFQFLLEASILTLFSGVLAVLLIDISLPTFNALTGKSFSIGLMVEQGFVGFLALIMLITAILSGIYPALMLASFKPSSILRASGSPNLKGKLGRRALILTQFGISIFLIAITYVTFQQTKFINTKDLGFNKDQVITFKITTRNMYNKVDAFRNEVDQYPNVLASSLSTDVLGDGYTNNSGGVFAEKNTDMTARATFFGVDHHFTEAYDMEILQGRGFNPELGSDSSAIIINESLEKALGLEDPINAEVSLFRPNGTKYRIIGVVKDFHFQRLHEQVNPALLRIAPRNIWNLSVRLSENNITETLSYIESKWNEFEPEQAFTYSFIDQRFARFYQNEVRLFKATSFFSMVSIFLTILGLLGMTTFVIERKVKEIGVRKVLGASLSNIQALILKEFVLILALAAVIATPLAYWASGKWLARFAYRVELTAIPFTLAALVTLVVIVTIVGLLAYRAAVANPVDALRNE